MQHVTGSNTPLLWESARITTFHYTPTFSFRSLFVFALWKWQLLNTQTMSKAFWEQFAVPDFTCYLTSFLVFFFLPKCPKISFVCKIPHIYVIVVLLLLIMQVHVPELSRSSTEALRFRAPELSSHDNGLMEIEAQYFGKAETGILRAYVLGKQKCLRS